MFTPRFGFVFVFFPLLFVFPGCVFHGTRNRVPKRAEFSRPLVELRASYPLLNFAGGTSPRAGGRLAKKGVAGQVAVLDARVLLRAWGTPNVQPEEAGFRDSDGQGSAVWVWQMYDKRVVARLQLWPIRKSKPFVEKLEVFEWSPDGKNRG